MRERKLKKEEMIKKQSLIEAYQRPQGPAEMRPICGRIEHRKRCRQALGAGECVNLLQKQETKKQNKTIERLELVATLALCITLCAKPVDCDQQQQRASEWDSFRIGALATRVDQWLRCNRANLLAAHSLARHAQGDHQSALNPVRAEARPSERSCGAHFDGHLCWPEARAGEQVRLACPRLAYAPRSPSAQQKQSLEEPSGQDQSLRTVIESIKQNVSSDSAVASAQLQSALVPTGSRQPAAVGPPDGQLLRFVKLAEPELEGQAGVTGNYARRLCEPTAVDNNDEQAEANNEMQAASRPEAQTGVHHNASQNAPALAKWSHLADYSECKRAANGDQRRPMDSFDPTDEWVKMTAPGEPDALLFAKLIEQLERIEITIEPYSEPALFEQWTRCIGEIMRQHEREIGRASKPETNDGANFCPIIFDGWRCWPATRAGETAYVPCPSNQPGFSAERNAHKICTLEADWYRHPMTNRYWSNYTTCVDTVDLAFRKKILNLYVIGNLISLIALTVSLVIFISFKSLNCTRVTIHKQLFFSFITNNLMWIVWYTYVVNDAALLYANPLGCRLLHILLHYFLVSNYFWMFCEGLYLHTLLVVAFVSDDKILKWFYLVGWMTPIPITVAYAYQRSYDEHYTNFCWMEESPHNVILMAPIGISLLLNLVFLINIVRVLVTKLRANNSPDTHQTRKAVRATLILIPLLGLHYMLTPFRPEAKSEWEVIYEIIAAVCTSFQGLCVAMLFCFCNGEVISVIRKKLKDSFMFRGGRGPAESSMGTLRFLISGSRKRPGGGCNSYRSASTGSALYSGKRGAPLSSNAATNQSKQTLGVAGPRQQRASPTASVFSQNGGLGAGRPASHSNASSLLTTVTESPVQQHVAPLLDDQTRTIDVDQNGNNSAFISHTGNGLA